MAERILLVDANPVTRAGLAEQLGAEGFDVVAAGAADEACRLAGQGGYAATLLDMESQAGEALARELKQAGFSAPILLLSADEAAGACERIAKPFRLAELLARLHALARRLRDDALTIGPYLFRPGAKLLTEGARRVRLTEKETDILKYLAAADRTVPRETLLHEVWGYNPAVTTHTLETHIYRLRRKIEKTPGKAEILITEGGGYRLGAART